MPSFTPDPTLPANTEAIGGGLGASRIRNITGWLLNAFGFGGATAQTFVNSPFGIDVNNLVTVSGPPLSTLGIASKGYVDSSSTPIANPISNGGSGHAFTGTLIPAITAYTIGAEYRVLWTQASQGNDTIALNSLSAITVKKQVGGTLINIGASDIPAGAITDITYDGNFFQLVGVIGTQSVATLTNIAAAWTGTLTPGINAYSTLAQYRVQFTVNASQGADTIALNGLAATPVKKNVNGVLTNLAAGDIPINGIIDITYDGTNFQIMGQPLGPANTVLTYDRNIGNPGTHITSSTSETTIYTKSVLGNTIGTDGGLRITFIGNFINTAGTHNVEFRVKFGGTTVLDSAALISFASNANPHAILGVVEIFNLGATNVQYVSGRISGGGPAANGTFGTLATTIDTLGEFVGLAIDTTMAQTLTVTAQLDANLATLTYDSYAVIVEQIQP